MSSSLGFVGRTRLSQRKPIPTSVSDVSIASVWPTRVVGLYVVTGILHMILAIVVLSTEFLYPVTVFETRIQKGVQDDFVCVYEEAVVDGTAFCSETPLDNVPSPECLPAIQRYASNVAPDVDTNQGPWIVAYELTQLTSDEDGATLAKGLLLAVTILTSVCDFAKALQIHALKDEPSDGIPLMWREYSITTAFLSLFLAATAQVFELSFLIASALSQFALMYLGQVIEVVSSDGRCDLALMLLWQPGMALLSVVWFPIFRSVSHLKEVLCTDGPLFFCERTCFERDYGFQGLTLVAGLIFLLFPMVSLHRIFVLSGTCDRWMGARTSWAMPFAFLLYIPYSFGRSVVFAVRESSSAVARAPECEVSDAAKRRVFVITNGLYALLSLTSKAFITLFFVYMFASRFPWRVIQRVLSA